MIRPPPISPLFPYTPLFRSWRMVLSMPRVLGIDSSLTATGLARIDVSNHAQSTDHGTIHFADVVTATVGAGPPGKDRSEEHTSELQSHVNLVCRLLLEKKKN